MHRLNQVTKQSGKVLINFQQRQRRQWKDLEVKVEAIQPHDCVGAVRKDLNIFGTTVGTKILEFVVSIVVYICKSSGWMFKE